MLSYRHFIITRFNINIYPQEFEARLRPSWLLPRLELFQRFCLPSLQAQHNQNFTWLVLFDEQTPPQIRKLISAYTKYPNFHPLYCGAFDTVMPLIISTMQELACDAEWLLTTRLDNDDALGRGFVHCLQQVVESLTPDQLAPSDTLFINFPVGLQWHDGAYYAFEDATNAFVSLLERAHEPHSVFWVDHPSIHDVAPVLQARTRPLWLQNVHDLNVYNYLRGERLQSADFAGEFPHLAPNATA